MEVLGDDYSNSPTRKEFLVRKILWISRDNTHRVNFKKVSRVQAHH